MKTLIAQIEKVLSETNLIAQLYQDDISQFSTNPADLTQRILASTWRLRRLAIYASKLHELAPDNSTIKALVNATIPALLKKLQSPPEISASKFKEYKKLHNNACLLEHMNALFTDFYSKDPIHTACHADIYEELCKYNRMQDYYTTKDPETQQGLLARLNEAHLHMFASERVTDLTHPDTLISTPRRAYKLVVSDDNPSAALCYMGKKSEQEDAVVLTTLDNTFLTLSLEEIKKRFWSTFRVLNDGVSGLNDGAVVSTTLIIGEQLLTATIGDCVAFAVFYLEDGYPLDVVRLNRRTHSAHLPEEATRVIAAGGRVRLGTIVDPGARHALFGRLAPSRAIGDNNYGSLVVPADADIETTSIAQQSPHFRSRKKSVQNPCFWSKSSKFCIRLSCSS